MKRIFRHLRIFIFRGILAVIPLGLTFFAIRLLYFTVDRRVAELVERRLGFEIPGLGIFLAIVLLYLIGVVASNWVGREFFRGLEMLSGRIPLIKTVYHVGRQLTDALSIPGKQGFKRVVLLESFRPGIWSVGFVTGVIEDGANRGENLLKIFIPTAPNPTAGFMILIKESEVRDLSWSVKDAMNMIISGGLVSPEVIE
jgi:uncharacterized membrane protein